jgi:uncharacterized membrane protein YkvA (DUF1232 family)
MANKDSKRKLQRRERSEVKDRLRSFLMFLPNLFTLLLRLIKDPRVPTAEKALFGAAVVYVVSPLDFIPDVFPFIGQVDDLYVVALVILRLINRTDDRVVRALWPGNGDIVALADAIAGLAPKFLPRRISKVITSRIEMAPTGKILHNLQTREAPVVKEIGDDHGAIETRSALPN